MPGRPCELMISVLCRNASTISSARCRGRAVRALTAGRSERVDDQLSLPAQRRYRAALPVRAAAATPSWSARRTRRLQLVQHRLEDRGLQRLARRRVPAGSPGRPARSGALCSGRPSAAAAFSSLPAWLAVNASFTTYPAVAWPAVCGRSRTLLKRMTPHASSHFPRGANSGPGSPPARTALALTVIRGGPVDWWSSTPRSSTSAPHHPARPAVSTPTWPGWWAGTR